LLFPSAELCTNARLSLPDRIGPVAPVGVTPLAVCARDGAPYVAIAARVLKEMTIRAMTLGAKHDIHTFYDID
jgi:hypothetical protein